MSKICRGRENKGGCVSERECLSKKKFNVEQVEWKD